MPADVAPERPDKLGRDARRIEKWSLVWMLLAMAVWGWFVFLMLSDYGPDVPSYQGQGTRGLCRGPFVEPSPQARACRADELRQWPALLGVLALAAVATVTAAATMVYAKVLFRLAHGNSSGVRPQDRGAHEQARITSEAEPDQ